MVFPCGNMRLSRRQLVSSLAVAMCSIPSSSGAAGPAPIVAGSAIAPLSNQLSTVQNSSGPVINWSRFAISPGDTARFAQPAASSAVLNRVTGQNNAIAGQLAGVTANTVPVANTPTPGVRLELIGANGIAIDAGRAGPMPPLNTPGFVKANTAVQVDGKIYLRAGN